MISVLGSEIGRGHPFYLDGFRRALAEAGGGHHVHRESDVFRVSRGGSRAAWQAVRLAYRVAGSGGAVSHVYHRIRGSSDYDRDGILLGVLGRDLRRWAGPRGIVVVDHPAVVGALGDREDTWYLHGEMVAPPEAVVRRAARVFVPLPETAEAFAAAGADRRRIVVTGICVEADLRANAADRIAARRARLAGDGPLTVAFFSSGAEPPRHVEALAAGAAALARSGAHAAVVFAVRGGRLDRVLAGVAGVEVVTFPGRAELDRVTAHHFPRFDVVVSPPHERSNWAAALGLPFLLVGPDIGPFAPRNRRWLLDHGVAAEIIDADHARRLPGQLDELRGSGRLLAMSERGERPCPGFDEAARFAIREVERRSG